ncbi:putative geraniol 8-hydroxylase [Dioscorea sansibarensis]
MEVGFGLGFSWVHFALALFCIVIARAIGKRGHTGRLPPGPRSLPIIGNLHQVLGEMPHIGFTRLANTYGPVMSLRLGQVITIVVSSPDMARNVFQTNDVAFSSRPVVDAIRALGHNECSMGWLPANQKWKNLRRICMTELFSSQRLNANEGLRRRKVNELIAFVSKSCVEGRAVGIAQVGSTTTLNLLSNTILSTDLVSLESESSHEFKDLVEKIMEEAGRPNLADSFPWLRVLDPQGNRRRMTAHFKQIHAILDQYIDERLQALSEGRSSSMTNNDFLDALLASQLDRGNIKSFLTELFYAGSDTSSVTVEWVMAELLRHPEVMAKVRAEILEVIGSEKEMEESDIGKLRYLQAVVKETLRMHPPAPFHLPRMAESDVELGEYTVPKGAHILVNLWAIGRDDRVWPEAQVFKPERFLDNEIDFRGRDFEFTPFGAGRRMCPGIPLGYRMVHLMLASLLQRFEWRLPDGMESETLDMSEAFGILLCMASHLQVIPVTPSSHSS